MRRLFLTLFAFLLALPTFAGSPGESTVSGTIIDRDGRAIAGAEIRLRDNDNHELAAVTDAHGKFEIKHAPDGQIGLTAWADHFAPASIVVTAGRDVKLTLDPQTSEEITVRAPKPVPTRSSTATRTDTPLRDVPQAVTVINREVIEQQAMRSVGDVIRYVPGIGIAQGEGNRDTAVFRGNSSTSDFFVDGIRDDVQYFRDLYNVERVEALKGPNAMIFGRGGVGGVLNRVTRQADWTPVRELTLQGGSWNDRRIAADFGQTLGTRAAVRITGVYEDSDSYRSGAGLMRHGFNPTVAFAVGANTMVRAGVEHFRDERTADRGVSSFAGRPLSTEASTFFGDPDASNAEATVNLASASIDHRFNERFTLRSRVGYGNYDKFYQNVYPGAVDATGRNVAISAYNNATQRRNLFNQTDLVITQKTGFVAHTILTGIEVGQQITDNFRNTGYFTTLGANVTSVFAPVTNPVTKLPVTFRQSASDADNHGVANVAGVYVQDQMALSPHFQIIAGVRYDNFGVDFRNNRTKAEFRSRDGLVSPRLGFVFKPIETVSVYTSYSLSYLPRAGEQLSSLNLSNQALEPEQFTNYEVGAKWEIAKALEISSAIYHLTRGNVAVPSPTDPAITMLVDAQESEGVELSIGGNFTRAWSIVGAYAYQNGEITQSISSTAREGARLAQLPKHTISMWNKYDFSPAIGAGIGVIHRDSIFASTDNAVTIPGFTRADAAIFFNITERVRAQVNIENIFDTQYYASAHSNTNITPGSPRAIHVSWTTKF